MAVGDAEDSEVVSDKYGGGGGGGTTCGRRKNVADCLCWLLFVVKSFTDVHRWMNVDDDIFLLSLSLSRARVSFFRCSTQNRKNYYTSAHFTMLISIIYCDDNNNKDADEEKRRTGT